MLLQCLFHRTEPVAVPSVKRRIDKPLGLQEYIHIRIKPELLRLRQRANPPDLRGRFRPHFGGIQGVTGNKGRHVTLYVLG